ncbi:MAG: metallophosphoesterase family protein [Pyrodictiaceae archaeon]
MKILVVSDLHGNIYSLRAVLDKARGWDEIIVLGDLVDYGPDPTGVIDLLREHGARMVRGNHDHAVAFGVDCRCGDEVHWLSVWFRENVTMKLVDEHSRRLLAQLPLKINLEADGIEIYAVHAAPSNPLYEYLYPWLSNNDVCRLLRRKSARLVEGVKSVECPKGFYIIGHTHYQFYRMVDGTLVANPGGTGQPRDGDPRAPYMLVDTDSGGVMLYRVAYDIEKTIRALEDLHIPEPYITALKYMLRYARVPPRSMRPHSHPSPS